MPTAPPPTRGGLLHVGGEVPAVFVILYGVSLVLAAQFYALTGWPPPGLIDKRDV